jgi:hypothetical protein
MPCAVVLAFILTIEICARIDDAIRFNAPFWQIYTADRLRIRYKEGLQINIPNARFEKWRHNSLGFRGPEISQRKLPGITRVVCLGASETYGLNESADKEWPAQLSALLPYPKYQVINASVVGLFLCYYKAYLIKYVLPVKPDIVICYVNPFFYASFFESLQKNSATQELSVKRIEKKSNLNFAMKITSNLRFLPKMKLVVKNAMQNSFPELLQLYQIRNSQKQIEVQESKLLMGRIPKDTVSDACIKGYKNELSDLVEFIESRGIKVVLCTYPSLISLENLATKYPNLYLSARRYCVEYSFKGMVDVLNKLSEVTRTVAFEKGTMFIDCQALIPKTIEYFADNVHYTDNGARLIANGIAPLISYQSFELMLPNKNNVKKTQNGHGG